MGVIIDARLDWSFHIHQLRSKVAKGADIFYKACRLLHEETLLNLYSYFVYPYFQYCIEAWGSTFNCYLDILVKLQKTATRNITATSLLAHCLQNYEN